MFGLITRNAGKLLLGAMAAVTVTMGSGAMPAAAEMYSAGAVVTATKPVIDQYWADVFAANDLDYATPTVHYYNTRRRPGPGKTPCGELPTNNSFYCPVDQDIYLDYRFLQSEVKSKGDFAAALVLAHEWGHYIAYSLGYYTSGDGQVDEPGELYSIQSELLADCFAGAVTAYFGQLGMLESGDDAEANELIMEIGDPAGSDPSGQGAHGSREQRTSAFFTGYYDADPGACGEIVVDTINNND